MSSPRISFPRISFPRISFPRISFPRISFPRISFLQNAFPWICFSRCGGSSFDRPRAWGASTIREVSAVGWCGDRSRPWGSSPQWPSVKPRHTMKTNELFAPLQSHCPKIVLPKNFSTHGFNSRTSIPHEVCIVVYEKQSIVIWFQTLPQKWLQTRSLIRMVTSAKEV